jgi:hypothetical protein
VSEQPMEALDDDLDLPRHLVPSMHYLLAEVCLEDAVKHPFGSTEFEGEMAKAMVHAMLAGSGLSRADISKALAKLQDWYEDERDVGSSLFPSADGWRRADGPP